ncbi:hypothetical protein MLD38_024407 [Melastoma candidum]|uniref:Uncharacterized protein n=1 Tax=Melastoma candidum TaxID=119954 RepID=A0ACB9NS70_9MYRT|nr:hypothetical protein MLD38_024407 [Melastoma candidum]
MPRPRPGSAAARITLSHAPGPVSGRKGRGAFLGPAATIRGIAAKELAEGLAVAVAVAAKDDGAGSGVTGGATAAGPHDGTLGGQVLEFL